MIDFPQISVWSVLIALLIAAAPGCAVESPIVEPANVDVGSERLTVTGLTLYTAPDAQPLINATVVMADGKIEAISQGRPEQIVGPQIAADGKVATAGLVNSHVHFTQPRVLVDPQAELNQMLLQYGFTQVVDTGSDPSATVQLRKQIKAGKLVGPRIFMANGSFVGPGGSPAYLPGIQLPQITKTEQAQPMVRAVLNLGADAIKIFSGSFISPEKTVYIEPDVIQAVVTATHAADALVFAHPTTVQGLSTAVDAGVDVIAHTTAPEVEISSATLAKMRAQDTALMPTLKLWRYEMNRLQLGKSVADQMEQAAVAQLRLLLDANITILFGTDVGYMADYDPAAEYRLMHQAGMSWRDILRSATSAPAALLGSGSGTVTVGEPADLAIYAADPTLDVANFAQLSHTIIEGKVAWSKPAD